MPENKRRTVSHSEIESFVQCRRKHFYSYGVKLDSRRKSWALRRGTFGHLLLEEYFKKQQQAQEDGTWDLDSKNKAITEVIAFAMSHREGEFEDLDAGQRAEVIGLCHNFWRLSDFDNWIVMATEAEYDLPLGEDGLVVPVIIDLIVKDPTGLIWTIDYKFAGEFFPDNVLNLLPQLAKYIGALRALGFPVDKAGYAEIRTRNVKEDHGKYMFREVASSDTKIDRVFREHVINTLEIEQFRAMPIEDWSDLAVRTANKMSCQHCSFAPLCDAELNGENTDLVIELDYEPKKRRPKK